MIHKIVYILVLLSAIFASCEKELDIDISGMTPKIVINSRILQDSVLIANVFRTSLANENHKNLWYIDTAKVSLYKDGVFEEVLKLNSLGKYSGAHRVQANTNYEIEVDVDGFATATATIKTVDKIAILSIDSLSSVIDPKTKKTVLNFAIRFDDEVATRDYYMINFADRILGGSGTSIYSKDPAIEFGGEGFTYTDGTTSYNDIYFSDELFNGKEYVFSICVPEVGIYNGFVVNLSRITPEYFKYMQTYSAQNEADGMEMFFQAVQVYSNVENGLGIFGALSPSTKTYEYSNEY